MVIFGASGDLTARKLVPALYDLAAQRRLPLEFAVVGISRTEMSHEEFRGKLRKMLEEQRSGEVSDDVWESFSNGIFYMPGDSKKSETYDELKELLKKLDRERGTQGNRAFYLSSSPSLFPAIVQHLGEAGMNEEEDGAWSRLVVEKPFGRDLESAEELNAELQRYFDETQIYRIDHYLGKETVQNILALRFANGIFEPIWNQHFVDHVQITVAEDIGVGTRGAFYEEAGALRDIVQNHVMQVLCLTAMEPPGRLRRRVGARGEGEGPEGGPSHSRMDDVESYAVRGQYERGWVLGEEVPGYREEENVDPESVRETFVALKLFVDNWRWAGVPFYIRAGKRMPKKATEVAIQFHSSPHTPFARDDTEGLEPNVLVVRVQPEEGSVSEDRGQGSRLRVRGQLGEHGSALRDGLPRRGPRRLPAAPPRPDARRPHALYPGRRGRGRLEDTRPRDAITGRRRKRVLLSGRDLGAPEADDLLSRDGREWRRP